MKRYRGDSRRRRTRVPIFAHAKPALWESNPSGLYQSGRYIHNVRFGLFHPFSSATLLSTQHAHPVRPNRQPRRNNRCRLPIGDIPPARTPCYSYPGNLDLSQRSRQEPVLQTSNRQSLFSCFLPYNDESLIAGKTQTICQTHDDAVNQLTTKQGTSKRFEFRDLA